MKKLLSLVALGACLSFSVAQAQAAAPAAAAAPSAKPAAATATAAAPAAHEKMSPQKMQQNKMKTCNADAKTKALKGAERKTFMKNCLKKS